MNKENKTNKTTNGKSRADKGSAIQKGNRSHVAFAALLIAAVLLSGCAAVAPDGADRMGRPRNMAVPAAGTWMLESFSDKDQDGLAEANDPMDGTMVGFSADSIAFAGNLYGEISYKIKRVDAEEYFLHKNARKPAGLNLKGAETFVVTAYSNENYILELIIDGEEGPIAVINDRYYRMKKISDDYSAEVSLQAITAINRTGANEEGIEGDKTRSGLLLGVRIPVTLQDGAVDYVYETYWLSCVNGEIRPALHARDIYLPRMDGFWKLWMEKRLGPEGVEDVLVAAKVTGAGIEKRLPYAGFSNTSMRLETKSRKAVIYVGNDYVCVENTVYGEYGDDGTQNEEKTLRTLPVDNLGLTDGIKISDLAGENGALAMQSAISDILKNAGINEMTVISDESQEKNFALYRKTGHWFFKGRLDLNRQDQLPYVDFNLNLIPPANMVAYDTLHVPWTKMKDALPNAIDIYTSPSRDMAVVLTINEVLVYLIENRNLSGEPAARFRLKEGSSVVMAEWCTGDYVDAWEKSFTRNNETMPAEKITS